MRLQACSLEKSFGTKHVLKGVSLDVQQGEKVTLLGPSGSGKSTLLRCLNGLEHPSSGEILVDGETLHSPLQAATRGIGMVFQSFNLFPHLNVLENVAMGLIHAFKKPREEAYKIAKEKLAKVGLQGFEKSFPDDISGGQKQRVAIARTLALSPQAILFDEPTSALDPENVGEVLSVIESLTADKITMVLVTHQMAFARKVSDRIVFMDEGKILHIQPAEDFFNTPASDRAAQFLEKVKKYG